VRVRKSALHHHHKLPGREALDELVGISYDILEEVKR
jgi:hypothetical protein